MLQPSLIENGGLQFGVPTSNSSLIVASEIIEALSELSGEPESLGAGPTETALVTADGREQRIGNGRSFIFGTESPDQPYVSFGLATSRYKAWALVQPTLSLYLKQAVEQRRYFDGASFLNRLQSVRVANVRAASREAMAELTEEVIHSCMFQLEYLNRQQVALFTSWPRIAAPRADDTGQSLESAPLKQVAYATEPTRFYRRGTSNTDSFVQYLSFYHVLEYYFVQVSDAALYSRMQTILNSPAFSSTPSNLDKVISAVATHKSEYDETEMLKAVLKEFVPEQDLLDFPETRR